MNNTQFKNFNILLKFNKTTIVIINKTAKNLLIKKENKFIFFFKKSNKMLSFKLNIVNKLLKLINDIIPIIIPIKKETNMQIKNNLFS